eukprot:m.34899 g.34899  ORF g.34899 m.34899 type:complete len:277 (-) comp11214_c0_seq2:210-1040(-)
MIPPNSTLVKYDTPVLISRTTDKKSKPAGATARPGKDGKLGATLSGTTPLGTSSLGATNVPVPPVPKPNKLPPVDATKQKETEDVLNSILPPREYNEEGQLWVQQVSSTPATRLDVMNLQEQLDQKLQQRQARETGICPVRRELYSQCFDELIRQVTLGCAERGLLLLRVRDEIRMTLAAYQTLYESSVAFGMRKALQAEQGRAETEQKISDLEKEKEELLSQLASLKAKCDEIEKREAERRQAEERKHAEEIQFLKRTNQQLKTQLESVLAPSKK